MTRHDERDHVDAREQPDPAAAKRVYDADADVWSPDDERPGADQRTILSVGHGGKQTAQVVDADQLEAWDALEDALEQAHETGLDVRLRVAVQPHLVADEIEDLGGWR